MPLVLPAFVSDRCFPPKQPNELARNGVDGKFSLNEQYTDLVSHTSISGLFSLLTGEHVV